MATTKSKANNSVTESDQLEEWLKSVGVIRENETLYDFLRKSYKQTHQALNSYLFSLREYLKPVENERSNRLFFYVMALMGLSTGFYNIQETSDDDIVKINAEAHRKEIDRSIINDLSPYILSIFHWDFNRRAWRHHNDEYKVAFLQSVADELGLELEGRKEQLVKKYISILIDFFIEKFEKAVLNIDELQLGTIEKTKAFKVLREIRSFSQNKKLGTVIDEDAELSVFELYKPIAQNYLEGLIIPTKQFDYLIYSFIEAQNDYKKFVEEVLGILQNSESNYLGKLKMAFSKKDIPEAISILNYLFATVPNTLIKNTTEAYYHIFIHLVLKLAGCRIDSEVEISNGRIDAILELPGLIYIIEFKLKDSATAIEQIKERKYFKPYLIRDKPKSLLGLSFNTAEKNISEKFILQDI